MIPWVDITRIRFRRNSKGPDLKRSRVDVTVDVTDDQPPSTADSSTGADWWAPAPPSPAPTTFMEPIGYEEGVRAIMTDNDHGV